MVEMWECEWWCLYKTDASVKSHLRENLLYKRSLSEEQLSQGNIDGQLSGYVPYEIEIPEHLRLYFAYLPLKFKNTVVRSENICLLMREYAEKENMMPQSRKMLI